MFSNNKRLERWTETGCRSVISLVDLEDKEFSSGTGPYTGHSCGTFPRPQGHPVGWDSVSSDIDVMWKKLSLLSDITKLITHLSLFLCLFLCLISEHQSPPPEVSVGQVFIIWSWFCFFILSLFVFHCSDFCWQALAEVWETCVYTAQSVRGSVCRAPAVQSVEIHERKHLSRYFKGTVQNQKYTVLEPSFLCDETRWNSKSHKNSFEKLHGNVSVFVSTQTRKRASTQTLAHGKAGCKH